MAEPATKTRHVRIAEDLADKLGDVLEVEPGSSAKFLDPHIREVIEVAYERNRPAIESLRAAREAAKIRAGERGLASTFETEAR